MRNKNSKMILMAVLLLGALITNTFAQISGQYTVYVNGMNTDEDVAEQERDMIQEAVRREGGRKMKNFEIYPLYSPTYGNAALDGTFVHNMRNLLDSCMAGNFMINSVDRRNCYVRKVIGYNLEYAAKRNIGLQFITYSRGNIIANHAMNAEIHKLTSKERKFIKRVSVASPDLKRHNQFGRDERRRTKYPKMGEMITSSADFIVGKLTTALDTHHPDYYYYNLSYDEKRKFRKSWYYTKKYNKRYYGSEGKDGHSLMNAYLNKKYGLYDDITDAIIKNIKDIQRVQQ